MEKIKIKFGEFWHDFDPRDNMFTRALSKKYKIEWSDDPDFFFFTHAYNGKRDYLKYKCHRIFLGWENERADWSSCDYVLDSDFYDDNPRHMRMPIWKAWDVDRLQAPKDLSKFEEKKKFCCMLISNPNAKKRIQFFHELSKYKKVDSGGRYLNNIGRAVDNKLEFIKDYKFVVSFENSSHAGYTTEKLIEPMLVNSIPIYWGNPIINIDFNTSSFINVNDFQSFNQVIENIIKLDNDKGSYFKMISEAPLKNSTITNKLIAQELSDFMDFIIADSKIKSPVALSKYHKLKHRLSLFKGKIKWMLNINQFR